MKEARKFYRYLIPGAVFTFQIVIIILFFDHELFQNLNNTQILALIISFFVGSGVLGYIITTIYYVFHWWGRCCFICPNEYRNTFKKLQSEGRLKLCNLENISICANKLNKKQAVNLFAMLWYSNKEEYNILGKMTDKIERYADIRHGVGATFFASLVSFIFFVLILLLYYGCFNIFDTYTFWRWFYIVLHLLVCFFLWRAYSQTRKSSENLDNSSFLTYARRQHTELPITVDISFLDNNKF